MAKNAVVRRRVTGMGMNQTAGSGLSGAAAYGGTEAKTPINIRLDAGIVRYFRAGGPGYQTRINEVLKSFVAAQVETGGIPGGPGKTASGSGRSRIRRV